MSVTMIGLDTAKSVFQVHGMDEAGKAMSRRELRRDVFEKHPRCEVVLEACGDRLRQVGLHPSSIAGRHAAYRTRRWPGHPGDPSSR
jgi:transposase